MRLQLFDFFGQAVEEACLAEADKDAAADVGGDAGNRSELEDAVADGLEDLLLDLGAVLVGERLDLGDLQDEGQVILLAVDAVLFYLHARHDHAAVAEESRHMVADAEQLELALILLVICRAEVAEDACDLAALVDGEGGHQDAPRDAVHEKGRKVILADFPFLQGSELSLLLVFILQAPAEFSIRLAEDFAGVFHADVLKKGGRDAAVAQRTVFPVYGIGREIPDGAPECGIFVCGRRGEPVRIQVGQELRQQGVQVLLAFPDVLTHADQDVLGGALVDDDGVEDHPDEAAIRLLHAEHLNGLGAAGLLGLTVDCLWVEELAEARAVVGVDELAGIGIYLAFEVRDDITGLPEGVHALDDVEGFLFPIQEVDFVVDEHEIAEDGLVLLE